VQLDVVVTDRRGSPVSGLRPEEFDLIIDSVRRPIAAVDERCATAAGDGGVGASGAKEAPTRHLAIVFDMSHMLNSSRRRAIRSALRLVDEGMTDRDRVMILALTNGLHVVSGFSGDRAALSARLHHLLESRELMDTSALEEESALRAIYRSRVSAGLSSTHRVPIEGIVDQFGCLSEGRNAEFEAARSLRLLANTMPALGGLPGRKGLVLFTEKLRANPALPFYTACGIPEFEQLSLTLTALPEIQDLALEANLAGVSFYPVHAGGLSAGMTPMGEHSARSFQVDVAKTTGGKSFVLMKDTLAPFRQALEDSACHYLLAFKPPDDFRPGRHSAHLDVRRRRVRVQYREHLTTESPEQRSEAEILAVLSNPGMYRDLPLEVHGYSLGKPAKGTRRFRLKASVRTSDLVLRRVSADRSAGEVSLRGAVISNESLACQGWLCRPRSGGARGVVRGQGARGRPVEAVEIPAGFPRAPTGPAAAGVSDSPPAVVSRAAPTRPARGLDPDSTPLWSNAAAHWEMISLSARRHLTLSYSDRISGTSAGRSPRRFER